MPLGTEQALVGAVSAGAVVISIVFAGIWWNVAEPTDPTLAARIATPAPFNEVAFCKHLIDPREGRHQIIVRANPLPENPPPPPDGILVSVRSGAQTIGSNLTDIFGCTSVDVAYPRSYVFEAAVEETDDNATHRWWSNAVTRYYDGESPGYIEVRLNNYARYGTS